MEKTQEQLQAESALDSIVTDESQKVTLEEAQQVETVQKDIVGDLSGFIGFVGLGFGMAGYKNVAGVWSNSENNDRLAGAAVPVLRKYSWGAPVIRFLEGDVGAEELALFIALVPVTMGTLNAIKLDRQEKQKAIDDKALTEEKASAENSNV
jgi:hypothetical protein